MLSKIREIWNNQNELIKTQAELARSQVEIQNLNSENATLCEVTFGLREELDGGGCKVGNPYKTYADKVQRLRLMAEGKADWGNQLVTPLAGLRSIFIAGSKPSVVKAKNVKEGEYEREKEFIERFFKFNGLDEANPFRYIFESQLEGKLLFRLFPYKDESNPDNNNVSLRYIPWSLFHYTVNQNDDDYCEIDDITYTTKKGTSVTINTDYVFTQFGGSCYDYNETTPKLGLIIKQMEDFDKAIFDWRKINHLNAAPTPHFDFEEASDAAQFDVKIRQEQWKVGKVAVTAKCKFNYVGIGRAGVQSIENEILTDAKVISGTSSVPVHFFGLPELLANRSTADSLGDVINIGTEPERLIASEMWNNIKDEAIKVYNKNFNANLDPSKIDIEIPSISAEMMKRIVDIYLPLVNSGKFSLESFLSKIPGVDVEKEMERIEEDQKTMLGQATGNLPKVDTRYQSRFPNSVGSINGGKPSPERKEDYVED